MVISESGAITEYLIDKFGQGKFAPARGTAEYVEYSQWLHFAESSGILPMLLKIFVMKDGAETNFLGGYADDENQKILTFVNQSLEGKTYLVGETLTGADFMMSFIVEIVGNFGATALYPNIAKYGKLLAPCLPKSRATRARTLELIEFQSSSYVLRISTSN